MNPILDTTVKTVRKTRRAYIGALGLGYDFARARAERRRAQVHALFGDLVTRGEAIEAEAIALMGRAKTEAEDVIDGAKAKIAPVTAKAKTDAKPAAKTTRKPSSAKRVKTIRTTETTATAKAGLEPAKKADTVKPVAAKPATAAKVAAEPKGKSLDDMSERLQGYVERVQKYDPMANPAMVAKIVTHLGVALQSKDGRYVACSDAAERDVVAKSWLVKKLGIEADAAALDAKVGAVCEIMKADRLKDRVVFYYLAAKNENALGAL